MVDIDDTIIEVHGYAKQGSGYGYSGVRGLNALLATVSTHESAPVVVAQRLRKGSCGSPRGAKRLVADALKATASLSTAKPLVRADSAFYGRPMVAAALREGADVSVTVRLDPKVRATIATIGEGAWTPIEYTDAVFDEQSNTWVSRAEVAEVPFTAFSSRRQAERVPGRLVVRRIPDLNPAGKQDQGTLFDTWRFHAFFTTTERHVADTVADTVAADKTHRGHAIIEQVHADLKHAALAHLPSGKFAANSAWLVLAVIAFNLTRAAATLTGPTLAKSTTATIRRKLITVPARIATSARRVTLHLPQHWPRAHAWTELFTRVWTTTRTHDLKTQPATARPRTPWTTRQQGRAHAPAPTHPTTSSATPTAQTQLFGGSRLIWRAFLSRGQEGVSSIRSSRKGCLVTRGVSRWCRVSVSVRRGVKADMRGLEPQDRVFGGASPLSKNERGREHQGWWTGLLIASGRVAPHAARPAVG
jgi:hypothetical protein